MSDCPLTVVVPVLNEAATLGETLSGLQKLRALGCELIVVDGGSKDDTVALAAPLADQLLEVEPGRAKQMNKGVESALGQWLLFVHADTQLPEDSTAWLECLTTKNPQWGFFPVALSGLSFGFRVIEWAINRRSRLTSVATGDQCLFVRREAFQAIGGFPDIPLMEDVAISKLLRRRARPWVWGAPVLTSSRRWEQHGMLRTVCLMWRLRLAYFLGVSPSKLVRAYNG